MPMSPEEMAAMQEQAGKPQGGGDITAIAQQVGDGLAKLSEAVNGSQGSTDATREKISQIMNMYIDFVERDLAGSGPGEDPAPEELPADQGAVPMQAGRGGVPMGPQSKM